MFYIRLEEQLREISIAKEELEKQQGELKDMMDKLEEAKNMAAEERQALEEDIKSKQEKIEEIEKKVEEKEEETRRLQEEVESSRSRIEQPQYEFQESKDEQNEQDGAEYTPEIPAIVVDPVEDREVGMDSSLSADLTALGETLKGARDEEKETEETKSYRENVKTGADKYKTLREVRKGNTKRRIDVFENL